MVKQKRKYSYVSLRGRKSKVTLKQFKKYTKVTGKERANSLKNKKKNTRRLEKNLLRRKLVTGMEADYLTKLKPIPLPEVLEPKGEGLKVEALVGVAYTSRNKPFIAELKATAIYKNAENYEPRKLLEYLSVRLNDFVLDWFAQGGAELLGSSEQIIEGAFAGQQFGIISKEKDSSNNSEIIGETYVAYSIPPQMIKPLSRFSINNVLEGE